MYDSKYSHEVRTFARYGALRLRSDEEHILTPLSEEILRPPEGHRDDVSGAAFFAA